jgi:hypothetical protein
MTGKFRYVLISLFLLMTVEISAQYNQVLYYMNLPQNHLANPALRPSNSVYVGLPGLTAINVNVNNNFVNFSDIFMKAKSSDSLISILHPDYNIDDFLAKIHDKNFISPQASVQLLGVGFPSGKDGYISLDIIDRFEGNVVIPGDLFRLAFKGNEEFVGNTIDFSSLRGNMKYYREIGVGYSKNYNNRLRIGLKGKLLFGIAGVSTENKSLGITVNDDYSHSLDADLTLNVSAPLNVYLGSDKNVDSIAFDDSGLDSRSGKINFISGKRNIGLGLDVGATYLITDKIVVSAAITDIGYIRWKNEVHNFNINSNFTFSGLDLTEVINNNKTFDELGQEILDSLKNSFGVTYTQNPYTTWLPIGVTLGGSYNISKFFSLGLLSYTRVIEKQIHEALTMSANLNFSNAFSTSLSYTAANRRFDNIGAGLAFRLGVVQFYVIADRIPLNWNTIKTENSSVTLPSNWNTSTVRLGMNLVFGNKIKQKDDKPMLQIE